jgi:hypothetical protein
VSAIGADSLTRALDVSVTPAAAAVVKLDVGKRTLALSVSGAREPAGGLPAAARRSRVLAKGVCRRHGAGEATHPLLSDVVITRIYGTGHEDASFEIVPRYRSTIF